MTTDEFDGLTVNDNPFRRFIIFLSVIAAIVLISVIAFLIWFGSAFGVAVSGDEKYYTGNDKESAEIFRSHVCPTDLDGIKIENAHHGYNMLDRDFGVGFKATNKCMREILEYNRNCPDHVRYNVMVSDSVKVLFDKMLPKDICKPNLGPGNSTRELSIVNFSEGYWDAYYYNLQN